MNSERPDIVVDTHVIIWTLAQSKRLSRNALSVLESSGNEGTIFVSVISVIELIYLVERGRISKDILQLLFENVTNDESPYQLVDVTSEISGSLAEIPRNEIPEMPDRIIAATARWLKLPLVTSDSKIRASSAVETIW